MSSKPLSEDDKKDPLTRAAEKNTCSKCARAKSPICRCGRGGGSSSDGDESDNDNTSLSGHSASGNTPIQALSMSSHSVILGLITQLQPQPKFEDIDQDASAQDDSELNELITIENDVETETLRIQAKPGLSDDELEAVQDLFKMIKAEFDNFKDELQAQGISVENFTILVTTHELVIHIPNRSYYLEFMDQLAAFPNLTILLQGVKQTTEDSAPKLGMQSQADPEFEFELETPAQTEFNPTPCPTSLSPRN